MKHHIGTYDYIHENKTHIVKPIRKTKCNCSTCNLIDNNIMKAHGWDEKLEDEEYISRW